MELSKILSLRRDDIAIRRGRQYLRQISGNGNDFGFPRMIGGRLLSIVAWSRVFNQREVLLAINTNFDAPTTAWVTIASTVLVRRGEYAVRSGVVLQMSVAIGALASPSRDVTQNSFDALEPA